MTAIAVALALGLVGAAALGSLTTLSRPPIGVIRENYAGRWIPVVLGLAMVAAAVPSAIIGARVGDRVAALGLRGDILVAAVVGLWVVGALDDAFGGPVRGIRAHMASLLRGRPTTGLLKMAAGVAAAVVLGLALGGDPVRVGASVVLIAVATNVWNALDVVPGRALRWGIVALVPLLALGWQGDYGLVAAGMLGAALGVLPFDLAERGMLGDAGSNPLGLVVGAGLAGFLPTPWVVVAAVVGLALQLAAETITISRLIDAVPPLRWFDRLGRRS
ncbi:MAG: hypothetical protein ACRDI0_01660 [Actinomycetota bacterium]